MPFWKQVPEAIRSRHQPPPQRERFASQDDYEEALGYWQGSVGRSVGLAVQVYREAPKRLLYRVVPHNNGVVFAEPDRAHFIAGIHLALRSTSWGQFRLAMHPEELIEISHSMREDFDEPTPEDHDEFNSESIPGWSDGDYPSWLQKELDLLLPRKVLDAFGRLAATACNGEYWHIPESDLGKVCADLNGLGFHLEHAQEICFH